MVKIFIFTLNFILSRGIIFFFPLFFANIFNSENYIIFEQVIAIGNLFVPIATLGFFTMLPKIIKTSEIEFGYKFIKVHLYFIIILLLFFSLIFHEYTIVFLSLIISSFMIISRFFSTSDKINKNRNRALFFETSIYLFFGFFVFVLNFETIKSISYFMIFVPVLYLMLNFLQINKVNLKKYFLKYNWVLFLKSSTPNLFSGFLLILFFQILKVVTPIYFDSNQSYIFLYVFRFSFIVFISYQLLSFYFFSDIVSNKFEIRNKKIFYISIINIFCVYSFILIFFVFENYYYLINDYLIFQKYLDLSIIFNNLKILFSIILFMHLFSFLAMNNNVSVSLLVEEKIWIKYLIVSIILIGLFISINFFFQFSLKYYVLFFTIILSILYVFHSILITSKIIDYRILVINIVSLIPGIFLII